MTMTTDTTEHPIIFNDWSIRRTLAGEKTQTRRIVTPQPRKDNCVEIDDDTVRHITDHVDACPYGQPGDVLWVREAFRMLALADDQSPTEYIEPFPDADVWRPVLFPADDHAGEADGEWGRKRPSIHMPRELCRIRLRIEDVRVERVKDITEADAEAEGIVYGEDAVGSAKVAFRRLWKSIHGDGAWERNDWVWAIEFSRIDS